MAQNKYNLSVKLLLLIGLIVLCSITLANCKGGSGGGSGGGGRGGGGSIGGRGVGRGIGPVVRVGSGSGKKGISKKTGGLIAAGGVASYAAYRVGRNSNKQGIRDGESVDFEDTNNPFKVQESKYRRKEGLGMSALGLILLVLGIIGVGTAVWCCYTIGIPYWNDKKSRRNRNMEFPHVLPGKGDEIPLHETPSTATPSP